MFIEGLDIYTPDGRLFRPIVDVPHVRRQALADRDTALGRWRSVEHPDFVVYPEVNGNWPVLWEVDGETRKLERDSFLPGDPRYLARVMSEYFAAHPVAEPKPWEQAQDGEAWVLTYSDDMPESVYLTENVGKLFVGRKVLNSHDPGITAGRRIFPEVTL